jgi:hypothetical protein
MNPPTWLDERGQPRPKRHCPRCGREIAVLSTPSAYLKSWAGQSFRVWGVGESGLGATSLARQLSGIRRPRQRVSLNNPRVVSPNQPCPLALCSGHASCPLSACMVGPGSRNRRQHPRTRVSWPVVIETGTYRYPCEVLDISNRGAKVITRDQLETGVSYGCRSSRRMEPRSAWGRWCGELMPTGWRSLSPAASTIASSTSPSWAGISSAAGRACSGDSPSGGREPKLRGYVLAHQKCGDMQSGVGPETASHYRLLVTCSCGVEFKRRVTPAERTRTCCGRRCWRLRTRALALRPSLGARSLVPKHAAPARPVGSDRRAAETASRDGRDGQEPVSHQVASPSTGRAS